VNPLDCPTAENPIGRPGDPKSGYLTRDNLSVCALVPYPAGITPSQRYRIEQWQPILASYGIDVEIWPFLEREDLDVLYSPKRWSAKARMISRATARRVGMVKRLQRFDVVMIHRAACLAGPALVERLISRRKPIVFDFDDAIYLLDTTAQNRLFGWLKCPGKTATLCRMSQHVVTGNDHLAGYARRYSREVTVVPSSIDIQRYMPIDGSRENGRMIVGWTGSATSQVHLERFAHVLRRVVERHHVEIRVVSAQPPKLDGVPVTWKRWSAAREVEDLREFDIGIVPLPDDEWTRGKSAFKALQCMGVGVPVVCSSVASNLELIRHGEDGFLASTPDEWDESIGVLIADAALRERVGMAGRRTVEQRYSMQRSARLLGQVLRAAVEAGKAKRKYDW
jgi:glycosyltransferase involved in cell wall biosynthesis